MKKKLCAGALMLGMALMLLQLRAHAGDGVRLRRHRPPPGMKKINNT